MKHSVSLFLAGIVLGFTTLANAQAPNERLNSSQIHGVIQALNDSELKFLNSAVDRLSEKIKADTQMIISHHVAQAQEIKKRFGKDVQRSETESYVIRDADRSIEELRPLTGADLDRAFLKNVIITHEHALFVLDHSLLTQSTEEGTIEFLQEYRKVLEHHLHQAIDILIAQ